MFSAEKYFDVAYECFKGIRKTEPKINPENSKMKALSPVMIMLSTAQTMASMNTDNSRKYKEIATECLNEILNGGFLTEKALLESVSSDGKFVDCPSGRIVNPGHSLEAAWFIVKWVSGTDIFITIILYQPYLKVIFLKVRSIFRDFI